MGIQKGSKFNIEVKKKNVYFFSLENDNAMTCENTMNATSDNVNSIFLILKQLPMD